MTQDLSKIIRHIKVEVGKNRLEIFDSITRGLGLRVTDKGVKTFFYRYRYGESIKRFTIGEYNANDLTVADARKTVRNLRAIVDEGGDPQGDKKDAQRVTKAKTVADIVSIFQNEYLPFKKASTQQDYSSRIKSVILPRFGKYEIDELTTPDIIKVLQTLGKTKPVHANRVHAILSVIFEYAVSRGDAKFNPVKGIKKFTEEVDEYEYSHADIQAIWDAIQLEGQPNKSLLQILLYTGQRLGETSRMKWSDINDGVWTIPASETKSSRTHIIPLTESIIEVLNDLKPITGSSKYVFESQLTSGQPIQYLQKTKSRIAKITGIPGFKIHHLRRIVATELIKANVDVTHVGRLLNHSQLSMANTVTIKHYVKHEYKQEKLNALQTWEAILNKITRT
jgi:integrase